MTDTARYRARWVFPVAADPIENGVVEVTDGLVTEIHDRPDPDAEWLGNVAIVPALVNAHTHLEFSDLDTPLEPNRPFTAWIRRLMAYRREREVTPADGVRLGRAESVRAGTGLLGEIATEGWIAEAFDGPGPAAVVFRELIALGADRIPGQLETARAHVGWAVPTAEHGSTSNDTGTVGTAQPTGGLSPHAPYSVHPDLYRATIDLAAEHDVPVAIHLAETVAELELLATGGGEIADMLREFGVWNDDLFTRPTRPLVYLEPFAKLRNALVIHGNYLANDEVAFLARHPNIALVFCPRTHAYFGHAGHPWRELLAAGGTVAIGTDGRGSNPDLSIWNELRFLHERFPNVPPRTLLELGTLHGARALGRDRDFGRLAPERPAHLAIVRLPGQLASDPHELLFHEHSTVIRTMLGGECMNV